MNFLPGKSSGELGSFIIDPDSLQIIEKLKEQARTLICHHCNAKMGTINDLEQTDEGFFRECPECKWFTLYHINERMKLLIPITSKETKKKCLEEMKAIQNVLIENKEN